MAKFKLALTAGAEADLLAIPFPKRRQINQRILKLADDPRPDGHDMVGTAGGAALVLYDYEALYSIDDDASLVTIVAILPSA